MDKIYSRYRIKLPQIKKSKRDTTKIKKVYFTMLILVISSVTGFNLLKSVDPIFEGLCIARAQAIATEITNTKSSEVLAKYNYKEPVQIIKSEDGKSNILKTDIVTINEMISEIALETQKSLDDISKQYIEIPIGALTGSKYLAGSGPKVKIRLIPTGKIATNIKTEFKAAGINQTVYRIYLEIECNCSILTSYKTIDRTINNQILLVENIIVGEVPETYLQLEDD